MSEKFKASLQNGQHAFLKSLEGNYKGITKVWFEPGVLGDESPCTGTLKPVLGNRFLLHEYSGSLQGNPVEGIAIYGCSLGDEKLQTAWVDSFHNGTAIMFSENNETTNGFSVLGHYGPSSLVNYEGQEKELRWGWRTVISRESEKVIITMYNIAPGGMDEKAVETVYEKVNSQH